jgi:LAS superfamily LD-carboxypeptidase LdcB
MRCVTGATRPRRLAARAAIAGLATAAVAIASPVAMTAGNPPAAASDRLDEIERRGQELDRQTDELVAEAEAAEKRVEELGEELDAVTQRVSAARDRQEAAQRHAEDAHARAAQVDQELRTTQQELRQAEDQVVEFARRSYMNGASAVDPMLAVIESSSGDGAGGLAQELHYLTRIVGVQAASIESLVSLQARLDALRESAAMERAAAVEALGEASEASEVAATAHAEMLELTEQASEQLHDRRQRLDEVTRERESLADTAEQLRQEARRSGRNGATSTAPSSGSSSGRLATVRGITVDQSIASSLEQLLVAAEADGFVLGGSGYRSPEVTARLRIANGCPDVYDSPASSCRIPTARAGTSEHESGLAIDFTWRGRTICYPRSGSRCSGNAAFDWLRANAGRFGFYNLPSEAWHWSTTGR